MPGPIWSLLRPPASHFTRVTLVGSFPRTLRKRQGLRWTRGDKAQYRAILAGLQIATAPLPDKLSNFPPAYAVNRSAA